MELGINFDDDGEFWMSYKDFVKYFDQGWFYFNMILKLIAFCYLAFHLVNSIYIFYI